MTDHDVVSALQVWYRNQCNDDWEHRFGIRIETLDNPGWSMRIDLAETSLEDKPFVEQLQEESQTKWYSCRVAHKTFLAAGGPGNLEDIVRVFVDWAEDQQP